MGQLSDWMDHELYKKYAELQNSRKHSYKVVDFSYNRQLKNNRYENRRYCLDNSSGHDGSAEVVVENAVLKKA